jgi:hypothetical protein
MSIPQDKRFRLRDNVATSIVDGQVIVVSPDRKAHIFNALGSDVVKWLEDSDAHTPQGLVLGELLQHVKDKFQVEAKTAEIDVENLVERLFQNGLLEWVA